MQIFHVLFSLHKGIQALQSVGVEVILLSADSSDIDESLAYRSCVSANESLLHAPFHETPATSDLLDCDLKYDADTLEHFSSPFGYEGPECSFTSLF